MPDLNCRAETHIITENASRYLQQLCKHFQHRLPASFDANAGSITFPMGETKLIADDKTLTLTLAAATEGDLDRLEDVVARHLVRFAFREELDISWQAPA